MNCPCLGVQHLNIFFKKKKKENPRDSMNLKIVNECLREKRTSIEQLKTVGNNKGKKY